MAIKVNLLPAEFRVSGGTAKILKITRMLGVISLAVFLVFGLGLGAFFAISSIELNNLNSTNTGLKKQLETLRTSETQFVVLKDRIAKIKIAEKTPTAVKNLTDIEPFISSLSPTSSVNSLDVDPTKISASMVFKSNADITSFVEGISKSDVFKSVNFNSFSFNPLAGYAVSIAIISK